MTWTSCRWSFRGLPTTLLLIRLVLLSSQKLTDQYPWYRTGAGIHGELEALATKCSGAQLHVSTRSSTSDRKEEGHPSVELDVVRISRGNSEGKRKAFFVFGEHARELISPEAALRLAQVLCGHGDKSDQELVGEALQGTTFVIVPNANPLGRQHVEAGGYCQRTNENGVDLNRNWGAHRGQSLSNQGVLGRDVNPGPHEFSEPETQILRDLVTEESPDVFVSVHSGAYLLGAPFGYTDAPADNQQSMVDMLGRISKRFCDGDCPYGNLVDVVGYKSQGCDIDYVKDHLKTPYAFTWEIYASPDVRNFYAEKAHARAEGRDMKDSAQAYFNMKSVVLLQEGQRSSGRLRGRGGAMSPEGSEQDWHDADCFGEFNPKTQVETEQVTTTWARAFVALCNEVRSLPVSRKTPSAESPLAPTPVPHADDGNDFLSDYQNGRDGPI